MSNKRGKRAASRRADDRTKRYKFDEEEKTHKSNYRTKTKKGKNKVTSEKKKKIKKVLLIIFAVCVVLGLTLIGVVAGIFFSDKWALKEEELTIKAMNTVVYDKDGNQIAELTGDENRVIIKKEDMCEYLPKAFVAIEDERFYNHKGVDIKRTAAATLTFLFNKGESSFGGSTITQQLVKNLMKDDSDSGMAGVERKIREMSRAYQIEKTINKEQILELYLNIIFMGGQYHGVETASEFYFSKSAKDLSITECAFLAGINHSPNRYNPYNEENKEEVTERIKKRTKTVLSKMLELEYINKEQYDTSVAEVDAGITFTKGTTNTNALYSYHTSAAIKEILNELVEQNDISMEAAKVQIYSGGYKIYTTQDSNIQAEMEKEFQNEKHLKKSSITKDEEGNYVHSQSAMVIIDHSTGYVVGTMGALGNDSNAATGINRGTQTLRQIGSTMKPIGGVAPALEAGVITAGTVFDDSVTKFGEYNPHNSTGYLGLATVREGIEISSNIMNLKVMALLGPSNSIEFLKKAGVTTLDDDKDNSLPLVLGALYNGMSVLETAGAYAMIANDGEYIEPTYYTKVEDYSGKTVLETTQRRERCMSVENAYIMQEVLTAPVTGRGGTATTCWVKGMEVGAKTGSTDDNKDRWLCGFTPYYAAACWYGFDQPEVIHSRGNPAAQLWGPIMRAIHTNLESKKFDKPDGVTSARICKDSGKLATDKCTRTITEYFVKGTVPTACEGHKILRICTETGLLANENCPHVEERLTLQRPETERNPSWKTNYGDKYTEIKEICTQHTESHEEPEEEPEETVEQVKCPSLKGMTKAEAKKALEKLGLVAAFTEVTSDEEKGTVIRQDVDSGDMVNKGTTINIQISKGPSTSESEPEENENNTET